MEKIEICKFKFFRGIFQKWHVRPKLARFPAFKEKLARARARAGAHMMKFEKYEPSAFTGKKIINFKWFLMILDYFENSWNDHEFLKNSFVIFMHILLAFWVDMSFLENASKKFEFTNFDFLQNREFLSKFNNFFPVKADNSYFSNFIMRARARAKITFSENFPILEFSVNFQHSK